MIQSVAYLNKWNIGSAPLIRTSFNKFGCKVTAWLPAHKKSYSRRFSAETHGELPLRLKEFVKHGLSNDTSRVLGDVLTRYRSEMSSMKSHQPDCPVVRCDIDLMIHILNAEIQQKAIVDQKHELKIAVTELDKWVSPKHLLNPDGKLTHSVYRHAKDIDENYYTRLRCLPAAEYDSDGVLRLKPHDPLNEMDVYYDVDRSRAEFWPLPKNYTGLGGRFFGLSCSISSKYSLRKGEEEVATLTAEACEELTQEEIKMKYPVETDSAKLILYVMWALYKGDLVSEEEFVVDLDGVDVEVPQESPVKAPPVNHVTIAAKKNTAVKRLKTETRVELKALKELPWKKDAVVLVSTPTTSRVDKSKLLPPAVATMLDVIMDGNNFDLQAVLCVHDALLAMRSELLSNEERRKRVQQVLFLAYDVIDAFEESNEFDWVEDANGRRAEVLRDEAMAALEPLLYVALQCEQKHLSKETVRSFKLFNSTRNMPLDGADWLSKALNERLQIINATKKLQCVEGSMLIVGTREEQESAADLLNLLNGLQLVHGGEIYKIQLTGDIHPVQIDNIEQQEDGSVKAYLVGVDKTVSFKSRQLEQIGISLSSGDQTLTTPQGDNSDKTHKTRQCCGKDEQGNRCTKHTLSEYRIRKDDTDPAWIPLCDSHQFQILHPGFSPAVK